MSHSNDARSQKWSKDSLKYTVEYLDTSLWEILHRLKYPCKLPQSSASAFSVNNEQKLLNPYLSLIYPKNPNPRIRPHCQKVSVSRRHQTAIVTSLGPRFNEPINGCIRTANRGIEFNRGGKRYSSVYRSSKKCVIAFLIFRVDALGIYDSYGAIGWYGYCAKILPCAGWRRINLYCPRPTFAFIGRLCKQYACTQFVDEYIIQFIAKFRCFIYSNYIMSSPSPGWYQPWSRETATTIVRSADPACLLLKWLCFVFIRGKKSSYIDRYNQCAIG